MEGTLHYLLMSDYFLFQKSMTASLKELGLTPGQPKILDYLQAHDGVVQKEIAEACHIEPATLTSVLLGMEKKDLILRKNVNGNRRSLHVYLTEKGRSMAEQVGEKFKIIEDRVFSGFNEKEKAVLIDLLERLNENMYEKGATHHEQI